MVYHWQAVIIPYCSLIQFSQVYAKPEFSIFLSNQHYWARPGALGFLDGTQVYSFLSNEPSLPHINEEEFSCILALKGV